MVTVEQKQFDQGIAKLAVAKKISLDEAVSEAARRLARNLILAMPPIGVSGDKPAVAKAAQLAHWKERIIGQRRRRKRGGRHLSKKEAKGYFAVAKKRQGELASAWVPAAVAVGSKGIPAWIKRHGSKHGTFSKKAQPNAVSAFLVGHFSGVADLDRHGNGLSYFTRRALKRTTEGLRKTAEAIFKRNIKGAKP